MENEELQDTLPEEVEEIPEVEIEEESEDETDWKAEALKQKAINQRLSKKIASPEKSKQELPAKDDDIRKTVEELSLAERKRQFGYQHNLSPEETDAVFRLSPNPSKETLEEPFVKGGLASIRAKRRVDSNIPSSSSRSASFSLPEKEDLTADDKQKAFEEFTKKRLGR
jgi:hypothetical protein